MAIKECWSVRDTNRRDLFASKSPSMLWLPLLLRTTLLFAVATSSLSLCVRACVRACVGVAGCSSLPVFYQPCGARLPYRYIYTNNPVVFRQVAGASGRSGQTIWSSWIIRSNTMKRQRGGHEFEHPAWKHRQKNIIRIADTQKKDVGHSTSSPNFLSFALKKYVFFFILFFYLFFF